MEKYLFLTKYNLEKSEQLKTAHDLLGLGFEVVNEYFSDGIEPSGLKSVPCIAAVFNNSVIYQTNNTQEFADFNNSAQAALDALSE